MAILWNVFLFAGIIGAFCVVLSSCDIIMGFLCRVFPRLDAWIDELGAEMEDF